MSDLTAALGPVPRNALPVPATKVARWTGRLPATLLQIWGDYGFVTLAEGRLHLVDPARLAPVMSFVFGEDPDFAGDTHAIAYGDLGEVVVWSERYGYGFLSPVLSTIEMPALTADPLPTQRAPKRALTRAALDQQFVDMVLHLPADLIETFDPSGEKLHARLKKRLGPPPDGMIYGTTPVPPPAAGSPIEHYVLAEVTDWLEAVYTSVGVSVVDWGRPSPMIRFVGEPWPRSAKGDISQ